MAVEATVRCAEAATLWELDRETFNNVVKARLCVRFRLFCRPHHDSIPRIAQDAAAAKRETLCQFLKEAGLKPETLEQAEC